MNESILKSKALKPTLVWLFLMLIPAVFCIFNAFRDMYSHINWYTIADILDPAAETNPSTIRNHKAGSTHADSRSQYRLVNFIANA